jgi:hypothetical protein
MEYNAEFINIQYTLIEAFMFRARKEIMDISYTRDNTILTIQVVLLPENDLSDEVIMEVKSRLPDFEIVINEIHLTREEFNETKDEWTPKYYQWLRHLLFSKAELS